MAYHRILTVQDISCVGQCSMTVALPVLSACGQETCILPTAVLSNHTGGFEGNTFRDLSGDFESIRTVWAKNDIAFDAVYTGYLGRVAMIDTILRCLPHWTEGKGTVIVDPAMADHGRLYKGLDGEYVQAMRSLCDRADILIPNVTEACMLTNSPYNPNPDETWEKKVLSLLDPTGTRCVVLTGIRDGEDTTGVAVRVGGETFRYVHRKITGNYHGTGDLFASAFVGAYMQGKTPCEAAVVAADFVLAALVETSAAPAHRYGVKFETALPALMRSLNIL